MMHPHKFWSCAALWWGLLAASASAADHTTDSLSTVKKQVAEEKSFLVDVREKLEWEDGHIAGAILLPLSELRKGATAASLAQRLPKDKILYTYCAAGVRSRTAADALRPHGYDVRPLKPGYKDLLAAGFPPAEEEPSRHD